MQRILIIEDDPKIAEHLQAYIQKYGFASFIVDDFDHVMEHFQKYKLDLVLLDINLPRMAITGVAKYANNQFVLLFSSRHGLGKWIR